VRVRGGGSVAYCGRCEREYPAGEEQCPECHHLLLPQKPAWRRFDPRGPLVVVCTAYGEPHAYLLKGLLEQEGIPVAIQRDSIGQIYGVTVDGLGAHRLLVPESLAGEAEQVLAAFEAGSETAEGGEEG